jgi:hypothetical protein
MNRVSSIQILELKGNSIEGIHHPWMCISMPREDMLYAKSWSPWSIAWALRAAEVALPPIVGGWEGYDQVGKKGWAELCDDLAAPVVMGKGAIDPWQPCGVALVGGCRGPANGVHSPPCLQRAQSGEGNTIPPMLAKGINW